MSREVNEIQYNINDYESFDKLFDMMSNQIKLLMLSKQSVSIHRNTSLPDSYILQFAPSVLTTSVSSTSRVPCWLNGTEILFLYSQNQIAQYNGAKEFIKQFETSGLVSDILLDALTIEDDENIDDDFCATDDEKKDGGADA